MKRGRHCALCGKEGGAGMTTALRLIHEAHVAHGMKSPLSGKVLDDLKAHGPCVQRFQAAIRNLSPAV